jgi:hypothetical protein
LFFVRHGFSPLFISFQTRSTSASLGIEVCPPDVPRKVEVGTFSTLGVASLGEARISEREQRYDEQF